MAQEKFHSVIVGMLEVNCYLVQPDGSDTLFIIDPGGDPNLILQQRKEFDASKNVILLTHAHVDHISGIAELMKLLPVDGVYLSPDDVPLYESPENSIPPFIPAAVGLPPTTWPLEQPSITVFQTPGHSLGGVCYYFKEMNLLFTGDTLFRGSVGRTDLPGGNYDTLMNSIRTQLLMLPADVRVYPGHGPSTTIGAECVNNPFLVS